MDGSQFIISRQLPWLPNLTFISHIFAQYGKPCLNTRVDLAESTPGLVL